MKKTHRFCLIVYLWIGLCFMASTAASAPLEEALQLGDLRHWREIYATPPPNTEWLSTMRASPIYWLLSPMTWYWLLMIWAEIKCKYEDWRLSTFSELGLFSMILALPIGWLSTWTLWAEVIALLVGLVILWVVHSSRPVQYPNRFGCAALFTLNVVMLVVLIILKIPAVFSVIGFLICFLIGFLIGLAIDLSGDELAVCSSMFSVIGGWIGWGIDPVIGLVICVVLGLVIPVVSVLYEYGLVEGTCLALASGSFVALCAVVGSSTSKSISGLITFSPPPWIPSS